VVKVAPALNDKVTLVTGGARGLGRGIVERFLSEGARVVIADVDEEAGREAASALGDGCAFHHTDVALADEVQGAVDLAVREFGRLDVMVNNAGLGGSHGSFLGDDFSNFDRTMQVNVLGVLLGCQRAARQMKAQGGGSIVNITSIGGVNAGPGVLVYRASKAAVIHATRCLAVDMARYQIRVNCIAPAHIPTTMNSTFDQMAIIREMQPLQRQGSPDDVALAALYLASDAAAQVTGVMLPVDGGTTAGPPPRDLSRLQTRSDDAT
jgi:NAD(P)-dependent dehydrogenase (short-subunit alcohol dehydrogenase family)